MLFEFDSDQRLWQDTVREVTAKECPPALIRGVVDNGADPAPLWKTYVELGLDRADRSRADAVELAIVLEELGRATDPTPYLATMTQFAPLARESTEPERPGRRYSRVSTPAATATGWVLDGTAHHVLDGDRAEQFAVVTDGGSLRRPAADRSPRRAVRSSIRSCTSPKCRSTACGSAATAGQRRCRHGRCHLALTGLALTTVGACQRVLDLALDHVRNRQQFGVPIGSFQAVKHKAADMHVAIERARALAYFAALTIAENDPRRRLAALDGEGRGRGVPVAGVPPRPAAVRRDGLHVGERPSVRAQAGQGRRAAARRRGAAPGADRRGVPCN